MEVKRAEHGHEMSYPLQVSEDEFRAIVDEAYERLKDLIYLSGREHIEAAFRECLGESRLVDAGDTYGFSHRIELLGNDFFQIVGRVRREKEKEQLKLDAVMDVIDVTVKVVPREEGIDGPIRKLTQEEADELKRRMRNWSVTMQPEAMSKNLIPRHWIGEQFIWLGDALRLVDNRTLTGREKEKLLAGEEESET